jgi:cation-transporting P-type ATPase I
LVSGGYSRPVVLTSVASALTLAAIVQTPFVSHFFGCRPLGPIGLGTAIGASALATSLSPVVQKAMESEWFDAPRLEAPTLESVRKLLTGSLKRA